MEPAWHFVISVGIGLVVSRNWKHGIAWSLLCGLIGTLPDIDHFMGMNYTHSTILLIIIPSMAFVACLLLDDMTGRWINSRRASLLFLAILPGHLLLDLAEPGGLPLLWPFSPESYHLKTGVLLSAYGYPILDFASTLLVIWFVGALAYSLGEWWHSRRIGESDVMEMPNDEDAQLSPVGMTLVDGVPVMTER